jgi:arylsulfate sulfotransferase
MRCSRALRRRVWLGMVCVLAALVAACGGGDDAASPSMATRSDLVATGNTPGITPFISFAQLKGTSAAQVAAVSYTVAPKPGSASKPVNVSYTLGALTSRGFAGTQAGALTLPVYGLYDGYANHVAVSVRFNDQSVQTLAVEIDTAPYVDPAGVYQRPIVNVQRAPGSALGFDFFALKSLIGPPVVVDTDGAVRWVGPVMPSSVATAYQGDGFVVGDTASENFTRIEWDGSTTPHALQSTLYSRFFHDIDHGKSGLLGALDTPTNIESTAVEFDANGNVLQAWDFAALLSAYMAAQGDDPSQFVRPGADWFHLNASTYDPSDDSIIASSRENFVIKVDYKTGNVVWIFGDPSKFWYTFPSLRAKALTLQGAGLYPIGQHAVSITRDGLLMLFDDGAQSFSQPADAPTGASRGYSTVSTYAIDASARTATQVWNFDDGMTIDSQICSSAYQAGDGSLLIDYADTNGGSAARLVGVDATRKVVFDFQYASAYACATTWNAITVPLDALQFN